MGNTMPQCMDQTVTDSFFFLSCKFHSRRVDPSLLMWA